MRFPTIALTVAAVVLAAAPSRAFVDQPISGKRIVVRDTPTPPPHERPARFPAVHVPETQRGHGEAWSLVR